MSFRTMSGQSFTLGSSISSTQTTILLTSFLVPVTGTAITMTTMGSSIAYGTLAPGTVSSELISFTGVTQNSDGTATLTGVTRGLDKEYPYTSVTGFKQPHSGQTIFILSDAPQVFNEMGALRNDNTWTGQQTFPQSGGASSAILGAVYIDPIQQTEIASKGYVDKTATGNANYNQQIIGGTAGETLTAGLVVYFKESDQRWWKADSSATATSVGVKLGIAQGAATAGVAVNVLTAGLATNQTGLTAGTDYYLSTAGAISATKGTNIRFVGRSTSTTNVLVDFTNDPNLLQRDGATVYATDTGVADAYAIALIPAITAADLKAGFMCSFKAAHTNTTTSTLNINSLGAKTIYKANGSTALAAGDIVANQLVTVVYDGTNFQMLSQIGNTALSSLNSNFTASESITALQAVAGYYYQADGGVLFDAKAVGSAAAGAASISFTVGNNTNRILVVFLSTQGGSDFGANTVSYGGVAMTRQQTQTGASFQRSSVYTLVAPATGANNLTFTTDGAGNGAEVSIYSYYNVSQGAIDNSASAAASSQSITAVAQGTLEVTGVFAASAPTGGANMLSNQQTTSTKSVFHCLSGDSGQIVGILGQGVSATGGTHIMSVGLAPVTAVSFGYVAKSSALSTTNTAQANKYANFVGFALTSASATQTLSVQLEGIVSGLSSLTPLVTYYLGDTAGTISSTAGTNSKKIGIALTTTTLLIKQDNS